jgi:hypothetical protein
VAPYREADANEILEVSAREGQVRLELGPRHFRLDVGERLKLSVAEDFATVIKIQSRRRRKQRSLRLGQQARLLMARGVPTNDIGLWYETRAGEVERVVGIRPPELLDDDAMRAWHVVDRMAQRLRGVLGPHGHGVQRAIEVGDGADRVLIMDLGDSLELYVRRLFRERARRAMSVHRDGTVALMVKGAERRVLCRSRYGVTVIGDYIRFADPSGDDLGALPIPWVTREDRLFVMHLIGQLIDPGPGPGLGPGPSLGASSGPSLGSSPGPNLGSSLGSGPGAVPGPVLGPVSGSVPGSGEPRPAASPASVDTVTLVPASGPGLGEPA